jgi:hypothetical protein
MMTTAADRASPVTGGGIAAVIFDMDGVVTDTARLHAAAWKSLFDAALEQLDAAATPFDAEADYHTYIDGRSREDGVGCCRSIRRPTSLPSALPLGVTGRPSPASDRTAVSTSPGTSPSARPCTGWIPVTPKRSRSRCCRRARR